MALTAAPRSTPALRGPQTASDERKPDRRTALADLTDELHALRAERDAIRLELVALRNLLTYAFGIDGWHIALTVRDRLGSLSTRLERRSIA
jgi:hypothetical protein